jgi:hypothetical protein
MKNLKFVTFLTVLVVAISCTNLLAQGRDSRSGSAQAAYGYSTKSKPKVKKKKKQRKSPKRKSKAAPLYRKKNPWAN